MKKVFFVLAFGQVMTLSAQQFNGGATNTTTDIYRSGNIGLGQTSAVTLGAKFHVAQSQGTSQIGPVTYTPTTDIRLERRTYTGTGSASTLRYWDINNTGTTLSFLTGTTTATTNVMEVSSTGLAIGTTNAKGALQIGDKFVIHNGTDKIIGCNFYNNGTDRRIVTTDNVAAIKFDASGNIVLQTAPSSSTSPITKWTNGLTVFNDGRVAIGSNPTTKSNEQNQSYKLFVGGGILSQEISVKLTEGSFPDYVFDEDYKLLPLAEVKQYIEENKHLPNMPSAEEVEKGDMNLKAIMLKQQEKIEELTLYLLQLEQKIEKQQAQLDKTAVDDNTKESVTNQK